MGDSDDEREFGKRRDKFHTERRGQDRGDDERRGGFGGGGMDWGREPRPGPPMGFGGGGGFRGGRGPPMGGFGGGGGDFRGRDRFSPERGRRHEMSPPPKRMRGGWEEDGYGGGRGGYDGGYDREERYDRPPPPRPSYRESRRKEPKVEDMEGFQPAMMSFKAFLQTQDDQISDEEAIRKYAEYKLEFKRQQLNEFFVTHKEEEWFRQKYHPEDSVKRKAELLEMLEKRIEVFKLFKEQNKYDGMALDGENQDALVKLLDSVVIMLEGGTENDLGILDMPDLEEEEKKEDAKRRRDAREEREKKSRRSQSGSEPAAAPEDENARLMKKAKEFLNFMEPGEETKEGKETKEEKDEERTGKKRKHSETEQEGEEEDGPPGLQEKVEEEKENHDQKMEEDSKEEEVKKEEDEQKDPKVETEEKGEENGEKAEIENKDKELDTVSDGEDATIAKEQQPNSNGGVVEDDLIEKDKEGEVVEPDSDDNKMDEVDKEDSKETKLDKDDPRRPRALHKTSSIFLRNLAPTITKVEVEALCRRYEGFLRSAIADPAPDRRWFRRGWVTFKRDVKIKDICFNLNNTRLRDCELGPIVNRDLTRRIRTVVGLTADRRVVRNDIKLAAKIITNLDSKWGLWKPEGEGAAEGSSSAVMGLASNNPLLANITDYLIEEASAEEEELLGKREGEEEETGEEGGIQRDEELIGVLDKMILYLRIVHSVDFYNHSEYPNEDEMPNRCGILHARGIPPPAKVTSQEVEEYMKTFEKKMGGFLVIRGDLTPEEAAKFGLKVEADEVEKFIAANTQELGKDKWLCPLSGKKFKGPDFVRKHIMTKHTEKVDEVKKEVNFFNNYLRDPKRPQLPEHPTAKAGARREAGSSDDRGERRRGDPYEYSGPPRDITQRPVYGGGRERGWEEPGRGGGRYPPPPPPRRERYPPQGPRGGFEGRPIITYRDWDAPNDDF